MSDHEPTSIDEIGPLREGRSVRLLDLFCGVGGCSVGYYRAGFTVHGVDIVRQPEYPYTFTAGDAVAFLRNIDLDDWDAIHASPPCKAHTVARRVSASRFPALFDPHPDLIEPVRELLIATGLPYIIENVVGSPLVNPVTYCGSSFGLTVRRHRLFESNVPITAPECSHATQPVVHGVYGNGGAWTRTAPGGGGVKVVGPDAARAMGIDWTERQPSLAQAIPPAYTEHIGRQLVQMMAVHP
jgi:DNA (cytosine-5)-methyltransferase 1